MSLSPEELQKIAHLSRLSWSPDDAQQLSEKMSQVMELVDQINKVDTTGIEPMAHPLEAMVQPLREDVISETDNRTAFQALAPQTEAGLYLVPKVIEE